MDTPDTKLAFRMRFEDLEASGDDTSGEMNVQPVDKGFEGAYAELGRLGMDDEEGFELYIPKEFAYQGHHAALRLERIRGGETQHFEANTLFEPRGLGERTDGQPPERPMGPLDETL